MQLHAVILFLVATLLLPTQANATDASFKLLWSKTVPAQPQADSLILYKRIKTIGGFPAFVATGGLITAPAESGPGPVTPWKNKNGRVFVIAQGKENTFWLGGLINQRSYVPGGDISDAYLAKTDAQGRLIDEFIYKSWFRFRGITDILPLDSGDVVAAERNWLAMVNEKGRVIWEAKFQRQKNIALSDMGGRIVVASIEWGIEDGKEKRADNVVVRFFSPDGKLQVARTIRSNINDEKGGSFGQLQITKSLDNAVYISSSWNDLFKAKPIEISKISNDGQIIWRTELDHSVLQNHNKARVSCHPELTSLANGDLLTVCAIKDKIFITRIDAKTGNTNVRSVTLPACHENRPASLFLTQNPNGKIWLFGSRPLNNVGASCTWLGELTLE